MSRSETLRHIIVPGYQNSGDQHWQSYWQSQLPNASRIHPQSWDYPQHDDWVAALDKEVNSADMPVVIIAHSLGCITTADWAATHNTRNIIGALLVAIPDVFREDFPEQITGYHQPILKALPFPTIAVLSVNDPYSDLERGRRFANAYGARIEEIGPYGHINHESGLGDWATGKQFLADLETPLISNHN